MERNAFPSQRGDAGDGALHVGDLSTVWVMADVFEYEAVSIRLNQPATLTAGLSAGARVPRAGELHPAPGGPATRTLKVRIEVANPGYALKPDMYGEVEFQTGGARRLGGSAIGGAELGRPPNRVRG